MRLQAGRKCGARGRNRGAQGRAVTSGTWGLGWPVVASGNVASPTAVLSRGNVKLLLAVLVSSLMAIDAARHESSTACPCFGQQKQQTMANKTGRPLWLVCRGFAVMLPPVMNHDGVLFW